jgi:hypothetical protein
MKLSCTVRPPGERWVARHPGAGIGTVEVTAASRDDALEKLQNELQYRIELCPCSGASADRAELVVQEG